MDLAAKARSIPTRTRRSTWTDHEFARGYAVLNLPFESGHLLGLRVFPENDFSPYVSVWHRTPDEEWSIYVDGPSLEASCPRYWGPALRTAAHASIEVDWTGPNALRVTMAEPALEWTLRMGTRPLQRALNAVESAMPLWTWRAGPLRRIRAWIARRYLGYGDIDLAFTTASGHRAVLLARQTYRIEDAAARLDGTDLGEPTVLGTPPTIGSVRLPRTPSFAFGQAQAAIRDPAEYERTRRSVRAAP